MPPNGHPKRLPRKPQGQPTRGKTARNRLRRVDSFLLRYDPALIRRRSGSFSRAPAVDLGFGAEPFTTLEMATRLRRLHPELPVLGVEIDPARVAAALPHADEHTTFRLGGFNLPLSPGEPVRLIRAFNVLRQYDEMEVAGAWQQLAHGVLPNGLLIDGTSDPFGRIWVANVLRRVEDPDVLWQSELLVFSTNFRLPFDPGDFQTVLPKNLIHCVSPGTPIYRFFADWKRATLEASRYRAWGSRQWFTATARRLASYGYPIKTNGRWLRHGYLLLDGRALATPMSVFDV